MTAPVRFDFGDDFSALPTASGRVDLTTAELEARLAEREAEGYARGFADGGSLENQGIAARLAASIETVAAQFGDLAGTVTQHLATTDATAVQCALAFARKLAGRLEADDRLAAAEQAFAALLLDLKSAPEVAIALHPDLVAEADSRLGTLMRERLAGFRLVILPDADLLPGDCRITWADVGLSRDQSAVASRLDALVARLFSPSEDTP